MRGKILLYLLLFMFGVTVEAQNKVVKRQHTSKTNVTKQNAAVKRKSVQKTGVYVTEDELGPGYYQIHNVPLLSTESHCWGLTSMIVAKDCTILHKWCIPKVNGTFVCSTADEFIEDAQTQKRYYIMQSDIGIGLKNKLILTDTKQFMYTEWYPPLPFSVKVINIYNGSRYIVRNLRLK
uniref:hypothetical protein n=1 Tax=Prevotella sp. TaxID=59823 RepID=UPI0040257EA9